MDPFKAIAAQMKKSCDGIRQVDVNGHEMPRVSQKAANKHFLKIPEAS